MRTTPEGIEVSPVKQADVKQLLSSDALQRVENEIGRRRRMAILREQSTVVLSLIQAEISVCGMTTEQLEQHIRKYDDQIVELAVRLARQLKGKDAEEYPEGEEQDPDEGGEVLGLGTGVGITHAIYHQFLTNRSPKELRAFLKNRRIPTHTKFAKQLATAFESMSAG